MAQYKLHCFCQSGNSYKVALYLACAGLDWEPVFVDFLKGQTRDPKWREAVNEMGEAPVLEEGATKLTQSGVILTYLADKTGKFLFVSGNKVTELKVVGAEGFKNPNGVTAQEIAANESKVFLPESQFNLMG